MKNQITERKNLLRLWFAPVMIMLSLLMINGCASKQTASLPAITPVPTGQYQVGKFVWFDLLTEDVQAAQNFYGELLGWSFKGKPSDYVVISSEDKPIGGMVPYENKDKEVLESFWMASLSVDDVDRAVSAVNARYGKVLDGPMDVKGRGRIAVIRDPEGAVVVLIRSAGGDPVDADAQNGEWIWVDLITRNAEKANEFYEAVAGYTTDFIKVESANSYNLLRKGDRAYAGVVELPWDDIEPNWLPYIMVDDLAATMEKATELGGVVILRHENIVVIADPTGGVFGIQKVKGDES